MKRSAILEDLDKAKQEHLLWMKRIHLMVFGFGVSKDSVVLNPTESNFGKWFYDEAQKLKELSNAKLECLVHVEASHLKTHDIYFEIYKIFFKKDSNGIINKLLSPNLSQEELDLAKENYEELKVASNELMDNTLRLRRRILAVLPEEIEEGYFIR